jgi:cysteinyl-tRNA synthetase
MALSLDPSANVFSTISSGFPGRASELQDFMYPWKKYGPSFISSRDMQNISEKIKIEDLNRKIEMRLEARKAKDFVGADRVRNELAAIEIVLKDSKDGTKWEPAR